MVGPSLTLQRAEADQVAYIERLLAANDLPAADVRSKPECFYIGSIDGNPVGVGGLELAGRDGLLRSVVVEPAWRGQGIGTALCDALETTASAEGVRRLYLLTTTAAAFFARRGYDEIDRVEAPVAIQETTEFTDFCPASAVCMGKPL